MRGGGKRNTRNSKNEQSEEKIVEPMPMAMEESIPDPQEHIKDFLNAIKNGEDFDIKSALKTLFLMQLQNDQEKRVAKLENKMSELEKKLDEKSEIIDDLESRLLMQEVESHSTKIVIRNLAMHKGAKEGRETAAQTRQISNEILQCSGISENIVKDTFRIYYKAEKNKTAKCPAMVVEFFSKSNLAEFMSKISDIKKVPNLEEIQVDRYIPNSVMPEFEKASKEAYSLRKKSYKTKVILTKFGHFLLLAKGPDDKDFKRQDF